MSALLLLLIGFLAGASKHRIWSALRKSGLRKIWIALTYWPVKCEGCNGTGLCTQPNPIHPHSCDGDCKRIWVPENEVPPDFDGNRKPGYVMIGYGVMYRRPWSKKQVEKPR